MLERGRRRADKLKLSWSAPVLQMKALNHEKCRDMILVGTSTLSISSSAINQDSAFDDGYDSRKSA